MTAAKIHCWEEWLLGYATVVEGVSYRDLRRLRLFFEDFPKNHKLILVAQPGLLTSLALMPNEDIQSRVTYLLKASTIAMRAEY